jgi:uncharacterized protein (TIGR02147 family)
MPSLPLHPTRSVSLAFSSRLEAEYRRRQHRNPAFSLRAFARQLDLDASELSKILKCRRAVGARLVSRVGRKLGWSEAEIDTVRSYQARVSPSPDAQNPGYPAPGEFSAKKLSEEYFEALSHWQYFAILSLLNTEDFSPSVVWIARRLGLTRNEVTIAVNRMKRLGLLVVDEAGEWRDGTEGRSTSFGDPLKSSAARRQLQKSYLAKSTEALERVDIARRSHSTMTMAADSRQLEAARELITIFRRDLSRLLSRGKRRDAVYCLNIGLFPLTNDPLAPETP